MSIFIMESMKLDCLTLHQFIKGVMSPSLIFLKCFRDTKNRCFHLMITERDLTDLCFASLHSSIKEKLEHYEFLNVNQLL
jgi:hypothetical protein